MVACPEKGPFFTVEQALDFKEGKFYTRLMKKTARILDPQAPDPTEQILDKRQVSIRPPSTFQPLP